MSSNATVSASPIGELAGEWLRNSSIERLKKSVLHSPAFVVAGLKYDDPVGVMFCGRGFRIILSRCDVRMINCVHLLDVISGIEVSESFTDEEMLGRSVSKVASEIIPRLMTEVAIFLSLEVLK